MGLIYITNAYSLSGALGRSMCRLMTMAGNYGDLMRTNIIHSLALVELLCLRRPRLCVHAAVGVTCFAP
jgi:hypothetical protein